MARRELRDQLFRNTENLADVIARFFLLNLCDHPKSFISPDFSI